ncbi:MAG: EF-hand domain-containing protein, partial [Thalassobaculaceae bacterium]
MVISAATYVFPGALGALGGETPKPNRNGLFVYGDCAAPEGLVVNVGSIQLYVRDETLEVTTIELAAFNPGTGWQSARTDGDHEYYIRMENPDVLEWAYLKEDAPVTAQGVAPGKPEEMKSTVWEYEKLNRCDQLQGPLALLHGEPVRVLLDAGAVPGACATSAQLCLQTLFDVADTHRDGKLTRAELSRILRVG